MKEGCMPIVALIFTKFIKMGVEKVRKSRRFEGAPSSSVVFLNQPNCVDFVLRIDNSLMFLILAFF